MVRESLTAASRHASVFASAAKGYAFQRRVDTGEYSVYTAGGAGTAPGWVRLVRTGDLFEAYRSADGASWTRIGSDTIPMGDTVYVGLAVTSHNTAAATTAVLDGLKITASTSPGNQPPAVSLTAPVNGTTVTAPATVAITATASDPENRLLSVDFYAGSALVKSDTTAPYSASWSATSAGTYRLTAVAHDADGGSTTSASISVTVSAAPTATPTTTPPRSISFTASSDHATNVTRYVLSIYAATANPATATPVATSDLGKPAPDAARTITVDRASFFSALAPATIRQRSPRSVLADRRGVGAWHLRAEALPNWFHSLPFAVVDRSVAARQALTDIKNLTCLSCRNGCCDWVVHASASVATPHCGQARRGSRQSVGAALLFDQRPRLRARTPPGRGRIAPRYRSLSECSSQYGVA